ncbi:hypothetical protein ACIGFL_09275 [Pseudomonas sp. NPDC077649]|uniref:hypothetical protein n=1 Tax=Pseudomonas sp. NPDC077649 TaxID=3364423 RepID=UPI0037C9B7DA
MVGVVSFQAEYDIETILSLVGAPTDCEPVFDGANLRIEEVTQEALDQAMLAYDHASVLLAREKINAAKTNNLAYEAAISALTAGYPASEVATFERQREEALGWDADAAYPTPWIDVAATARGLDRVEYLTRTLAKAQVFASASAFLTGRRQGIDDAIKMAVTVEAVAAVDIDYTFPEAP